ncbi:MAG: hypothetical protein M0036_03925 [Desulfobacteraceae bacterium]|nr:hypothetical protein [Desulfobacteraceae bacterium]
MDLNQALPNGVVEREKTNIVVCEAYRCCNWESQKLCSRRVVEVDESGICIAYQDKNRPTGQT